MSATRCLSSDRRSRPFVLSPTFCQCFSVRVSICETDRKCCVRNALHKGRSTRAQNVLRAESLTKCRRSKMRDHGQKASTSLVVRHRPAGDERWYDKQFNDTGTPSEKLVQKYAPIADVLLRDEIAAFEQSALRCYVRACTLLQLMEKVATRIGCRRSPRAARSPIDRRR